MERIIAVVGIDAADITYRLSDNSLLAVPHGGHVYHVGDDVGFPGSGLGRVRSGAAGSPISPSPAAPVEPEPVSELPKPRSRKKAGPRDATSEEQAAADAVADKKEAEAE